MKAEEVSSKVRQILQDYRRRDDYSLASAERDMLNLLILAEERAKMPSEEEIRKSNPYPESVFIPIDAETLRRVIKYLKQGGYSPDALFGNWGRSVWNNCCKWWSDRMSKPNNHTEGGEK